MRKILYNKETILQISEHLNDLKDKFLIDNYDEYYIFKDFEIKSITHKVGFIFKKISTDYYINYINIVNGVTGEVVNNKNSILCSIEGVNTLLNYRNNWINFEKKMIQLSYYSKVPLNFTSMNLK